MASTVALPPQSSASAMARTEGVQRGGSLEASVGRPLLETIRDRSAISAAPVSSTQPTPAAESASRAPGDMRRAATTSGWFFWSAINSRACRSPPSPSQWTWIGSPLSLRSTEWRCSRPRRIWTARGSTAATLASERWAILLMVTSSAESSYPQSLGIHHNHDDVCRSSEDSPSVTGVLSPSIMSSCQGNKAMTDLIHLVPSVFVPRQTSTQKDRVSVWKIERLKQCLPDRVNRWDRTTVDLNAYVQLMKCIIVSGSGRRTAAHIVLPHR